MNEREVIRSIAYARRISHEEIARAIGASRSNVSNLLRGEVPLRADKLSAMCEAIGAELIIREGEEEWKI